jgi:hypothetical protein
LRKGITEIEGKATRVGASECGQRASFNRGKELARTSYQAAVIASGYSFAPERRTATLLQVANFKKKTEITDL